MTPVMQACYAFAATVFSAIFLVAIIVYGEEWARLAALAATFAACASQFTAQDAANDLRIYVASIYLAYASFILALVALLLFAAGR